MKVCKKHWQLVVEAVKARGMGEYISPNAKESERRKATGELDPLNTMQAMIFSGALEQKPGLIFMDVRLCPVCFLKAPEMITMMADWLLSEAKRLGKIKEH